MKENFEPTWCMAFCEYELQLEVKLLFQDEEVASLTSLCDPRTIDRCFPLSLSLSRKARTVQSVYQRAVLSTTIFYIYLRSKRAYPKFYSSSYAWYRYFWVETSLQLFSLSDMVSNEPEIDDCIIFSTMKLQPVEICPWIKPRELRNGKRTTEAR